MHPRNVIWFTSNLWSTGTADNITRDLHKKNKLNGEVIRELPIMRSEEINIETKIYGQ